MTQTIDIKVPDIGDFKDVPVIEVLVASNDAIEKETPLITLETDKASIEVPSPHAGVVQAIHVKVGDKVSAGSTILTLTMSDVPIAQNIPKPTHTAAPASSAASASTRSA